MSLQDESFPADDLFDQLNSLGAGSAHDFKRQFGEHPPPEAFERNPAPFPGSDCSAENSFTDADANKSAKTCVSDPAGRGDPRGEDGDEDDEQDATTDGQDGGLSSRYLKAPLGSARNSKAASYQDIHSAYTKRRYQHVTSKVAKYIADIQAQDEERRSRMHRHSSMPEYLTPKSRPRSNDGHYSVDELTNSSGEGEGVADTHEHCERLMDTLRQERDRQLSYSNYLQDKLDKKVIESMELRINFDEVRGELADCKQKLTRYQALSLRSLNGPPVGVPKATQTERQPDRHLLPVAAISLTAPPGSASSAVQYIMENYVTPHPTHGHAPNLTFNSSDGSIELALLSVAPPTARQPHPELRNVQPLSLDFSNESGEVAGNTASGSGNSPSSSRARRERGPGPNNSESSHPSSNDSAIEVEGHESRSPFQQQQEEPSREWRHRPRDQAIYYFDKRNNRVVEVMSIDLGQRQSQSGDINHNQSQSSVNDSQAQLLSNSQAQMPFRTKRRSLGSRVMQHLLGPCVRCRYFNAHLDSSQVVNGTYTVGLPLLDDDYAGQRNRH
ncbi:hypothetical protein KR018_008469 [Drosophila ironensis]|nr:hypothetical protein KR018_008469 [Drosophila ironensis]